MNNGFRILLIATLLTWAHVVFADATNPILDDPPGTEAATICTLVNNPARGGSYLASIPTICPIGHATVPVQVAEGVAVYEHIGEPMLARIRVGADRTYTILALHPPPPTDVSAASATTAAVISPTGAPATAVPFVVGILLGGIAGGVMTAVVAVAIVRRRRKISSRE